MADTTITAILGLATILGSGVVAGYVTHRLTRNQNQFVFLREKAEALYLAADEYGRRFGGQMVTYFPLLEGRYDYNDMLDKQNEFGSASSKYGGAETMTMIVEIYFPSVRPALQGVWDARAEFNKVTAAIRALWERQAEVSEMGTPFRRASLKVDKAIENLKSEIVIAARAKSGVKQ
ncbi:hypothetical protein D2V17_19425 [Aurantiacibacter xanthus]|uniref:Uncharacterized protein n=1 Tax=Aurantiacibacter xanthus TaxID=1784712 RepID=A0A3A1P4A4_9SPHN|nr:hypothetical protein [Aurantiacibacter xanthus]RIV80484.1 hypothetical protein D2V17_19425 [Aurantiacibacter xanthus]